MRYLLLHVVCILLCTKASPQKGFGPLAPTIATTALPEMNDREWNYSVSETGASWEKEENVTGTLFFTEDYNSGYILLDGNRLAKNVSIRFNVYSSQVYLRKKDNQVIVLGATVPIAEFGYWDSSQSKATVFRRGYPDIGDYTGKTFYEVVEYGKLSLLEQHDKRIVEKRDIHGVPQKIVSDAETWFVYDSTGNKMVEIKHNKNSLLEALPSYSSAIQSIIQDKKLKLKSDGDWSVLFKELNSK